MASSVETLKQIEDVVSYDFLWNVPKEKRKEVLRERLPVTEFVRIFGKDFKRMKLKSQKDLKITVPDPFKFHDNKQQLRYYERFLNQLLAEIEEASKHSFIVPFAANPIPPSHIEPLYEQQQLKEQIHRSEWKEKRYINRRPLCETRRTSKK